jgi:hypothetical protein
MTLATEIRLLQGDMPDIDEVFHKLREIIGIPESHPFRVGDGDYLESVPGGFMSALTVSGPGRLDGDEIDETEQPSSWAMSINLDTSYTAKTPYGGASDVHNHIIARFAAAFPIVHWAAWNEFDDTWHINKLPYA